MESDDSEWLEEVTRVLVTRTPDTTPRKPQARTSTRPVQTNRSPNKIPLAIDPRSHPASSMKLSRTLDLTSRSPTKPSSTPTRASKKPQIIWISSEDEDDGAGDTESDSETSSIFDRGLPSRQSTLTSIASDTLSVSRAGSRPMVSEKSSVSPCNSTPISSDDDGFFTSSSDPSSSSFASLSLTSRPSTSSESSAASGPPPSPTKSGPALINIAHDQETQKLFDDIRGPVPWGTQYELARGVILKEWTWEKVREKVHKFAGKSDAEVMHLVCYVMKDMPPPKLLKNDIGQESDREQLALLENRGRGLGLMGPFQGVDNWFGGQIQQIATLRETAKFVLILQLEPLEMRRSTRFARQFGSRRVIQVRIPRNFLQDHTRDRTIRFLSRKFVLNGRVFAPTPPKEGAVYLVEINEDHERIPMNKLGDQHRKSLRGVLDWHNPMELNSQQPVSKYAARAALALSNSVPALEFQVENIHFIEDIIASDCKEKKPPAHKVLTDGCGFMNEAALRAIATALNYPSRPTAVQGRIAGSKGLWTIHPDKTVNASDIPQIWIRDSQRKIVYSQFDSASKHYRHLDKVHRILDLCHAALPSLSSTSGPSISLNKQSALNLWANGVPLELFKELMKKGLEETIEPLMQWDGQFAMPALWDAINKAGKVTYIRTARVGAGMARALGLAGRDYTKEGSTPNEPGAGDMSPVFTSTVTGRNEYSGAPIGLHETALELVQAGFHPAKDSILWSTLQKVLEVTIQGAVEKCNIPLPEGSSASAFVIPDPLGVLEENEIYYRSSAPIRDPNTQTLFHVITGEVLIFRYPLRVASDTQKVIAVDKPELAPWSDVFIVPTKPSASGNRETGLVSMMSKCSGGDQDGDDLFVIWLDSLVKPFKQSPLVVEPKDISSNFEDRVQRLDSFLTRAETGADPEHSLISAFLTNLTNSSVGLYDSFHECAVREKGYKSKEAIRLAFLFNRLIDAPKTGAVLRRSVLQDDSKQKKLFLERQAQSGLQEPFILDELQAFGQDLLTCTMEKLQQLPPSSERSQILLEPYTVAQSLCRSGSVPVDTAVKIAKSSETESRNVERILVEARRSDLRLIEDHVDRAFRKFCFLAGRSTEFAEERTEKKKKQSSRTDLMDPAIALYAQEIEGLTNTIPNVEQVKASYAYSKGKTFYFGKTVAFRTLCEIQVKASNGGGAPCFRLLDQVKSISGGARRLFAQ